MPQTSAMSPKLFTRMSALIVGIMHSSSKVTLTVRSSSGSSSANTPSGILPEGAAPDEPPAAGLVISSALSTSMPFCSLSSTASLLSVTNFMNRPFLSISAPDLSSLRSGGYVPQTSAMSPKLRTSISPRIVGIMHSSKNVTFAVMTSSGSSSGKIDARSKPPSSLPPAAAAPPSPFITAAKALILFMSSVKSVSSCESSWITSISFFKLSDAAKSSSYMAGLSYCTELSSRII